MADDIKRYCPAKDPPALCEHSCGMGACVVNKIHDAWHGQFPKEEIHLRLRQFEQAVKQPSSFWQSVSELAAMREHIPEERRALSGVRAAMAADVKEQSDE